MLKFIEVYVKINSFGNFFPRSQKSPFYELEVLTKNVIL